MMVKVYVNWYEREVINEKDFKKKVEEATKVYKEDEDFFGEWLSENYSAWDIWVLNEEQRKEVRNDFLNECERLGVNYAREDWEENEIEI